MHIKNAQAYPIADPHKFVAGLSMLCIEIPFCTEHDHIDLYFVYILFCFFIQAYFSD